MAEGFCVEHNSQDAAYRFPVGAMPAGGRIWLGVRITGAAEAIGDLCVWQDGIGQRLYELKPSPSGVGGATELWLGTTLQLSPQSGLVWYYFVLVVDGRTLYCGNNMEQLGGLGMVSEEPPLSFQITVHDREADTPAWFRRAVMYQIFPDRFCRSGQELPKKQQAVFHPSWKDVPHYYKDEVSGEILAYDFFGGDLAGIRSRLPYLRDLGISVIYLNPIFEAESNHRYDTGDYKKIDPLLGTEAEFKKLCQEAWRMGIRILLDGVFSHTGSDSRYFNKRGSYDSVGAYQSKASPYYKWYDFVDYPDAYHSWWGFDTLPNVRETEPSYMAYMIEAPDSVLHHWLAAGISGWRLDVVDELPAKFSQAFYRTMKKAAPEAVLIGEVWEDASHKVAYGEQRAYFSGHELDGAMNYPFRTAVLDFLLGHIEAPVMARRLESLRENYPRHNFYAMMNLLGSHDVERVMTVLGEAPAAEGLSQRQRGAYRLPESQAALGRSRVELAMLWQMTYPGVPSIYYGDEIGTQGYRDPYNRTPYDWKGGDASLREMVRLAIRLRNNNPALSTGEFIPLHSEGDIYAYARLIRNGQDVFGQPAENKVFVIALNRGSKTVDVSLMTGDFARGSFREVLTVGHMAPKLAPTAAAPAGQLALRLPPLSGAVYEAEPPVIDLSRQAGVLLHVTSLPSLYGIGDMGPAAYQFIDFLAAAGQRVWQILPLQPVREDASPYTSPSAFAGNPLLIAFDWLEESGWLTAEEIAPPEPAAVASFEDVAAYKKKVLHQAWKRFRLAPPVEYGAFCQREKDWLESYALFEATREREEGRPWFEWEPALRRCEPEAIQRQCGRVRLGMDFVKFQQFCFYKQWMALRAYAKDQGVRILGDMPLFLSLDSVDVWQNQGLFQLDDRGRPRKVAGVPPDYFSPTGQLWGNPQYDWQVLKNTGYAWWIARFRHLMRFVDAIRIDHFRGLESYWEVDARAKTAAEGRWVKGPGKDLVTALWQALGNIPIVAEDLGVITEAVHELRESCGFPGMKVLQFELFDNGTPRVGAALTEDCLVYTGTHDNNTVAGWYEEDLTPGQRRQLSAYFGLTREASGVEVAVRLVELAYASPARLAIIPMQDILGLGSDQRMNRPGTVGGNWLWRLSPGQLGPLLAKRLKGLCERYLR